MTVIWELKKVHALNFMDSEFHEFDVSYTVVS